MQQIVAQVSPIDTFKQEWEIVDEPSTYVDNHREEYGDIRYVISDQISEDGFWFHYEFTNSQGGWSRLAADTVLYPTFDDAFADLPYEDEEHPYSRMAITAMQRVPLELDED